MMKTQNVWTDNIKLGQEFGTAGKRAEVIVQRMIFFFAYFSFEIWTLDIPYGQYVGQYVGFFASKWTQIKEIDPSVCNPL